MTKEIYEVNVEGKIFQAPVNPKGLTACYQFIIDNGVKGIRYPIKYKAIKEDK